MAAPEYLPDEGAGSRDLLWQTVDDQAVRRSRVRGRQAAHVLRGQISRDPGKRSRHSSSLTAFAGFGSNVPHVNLYSTKFDNIPIMYRPSGVGKPIPVSVLGGLFS
jgi:hypothetical protein